MKAVISQHDTAYLSIFKPFARAYALGYVTTISPKVCTILLSCLSKGQRDGNTSARVNSFLHSLLTYSFSIRLIFRSRYHVSFVGP